MDSTKDKQAFYKHLKKGMVQYNSDYEGLAHIADIVEYEEWSKRAAEESDLELFALFGRM